MWFACVAVLLHRLHSTRGRRGVFPLVDAARPHWLRMRQVSQARLVWRSIQVHELPGTFSTPVLCCVVLCCIVFLLVSFVHTIRLRLSGLRLVREV